MKYKVKELSVSVDYVCLKGMCTAGISTSDSRDITNSFLRFLLGQILVCFLNLEYWYSGKKMMRLSKKYPETPWMA